MKLFKIITFISIILSHAAIADTVKLKNGDILTGTVIKKETDKLIFETNYAGEIKITWSEIASLSTDQPVTVMLADESIFTGEIQQVEEESEQVNLLGLEASTEVSLKDIAYINPSPEVSGKGVAWSGRANLGGATAKGNTDNSQIRFDTETIARTKQSRYTLGANVFRAKADGQSTAFNSKGYAQHDRFISKKWYLYANGSLEHDKFRDIKLRSSTGLGTGYQIFEQEDTNLSVEGGINYINTNFNDADDERYASGRWALKYDQLVFHGVKFFHQHEVLVSLEDAANTLAFTRTGLRVPIAHNLNASTELIVDYAGQPADNRERVDRTLLFSLGYGW
jgi:putative salt-induced outer membrane protein YdiY